jgi:hypothetical protein
MTLDYQIHRIKGRVEASGELHWYGANGYWKVEILGFGRSKATAIESAEAMAMAARARVALQIATLELNRVLDLKENVGA